MSSDLFQIWLYLVSGIWPVGRKQRTKVSLLFYWMSCFHKWSFSMAPWTQEFPRDWILTWCILGSFTAGLRHIQSFPNIYLVPSAYWSIICAYLSDARGVRKGFKRWERRKHSSQTDLRLGKNWLKCPQRWVKLWHCSSLTVGLRTISKPLIPSVLSLVN
jgi:hypothetical protein